MSTETINAPYPEVAEKWYEVFDRKAKDAIGKALLNGEQSFEVEHIDIAAIDDGLAEDVIHSYESAIDHANAALEAFHIDILEGQEEPRTPDDLTIRITNVSRSISVSELRSEHVGEFIGIRGQVSMASQVRPRTTEILFECQQCRNLIENWIPQITDEIQAPATCPHQDHAGVFTVFDERTVDHQIIELAPPASENVGTTGQTIPIHIRGDLCGKIMPGDLVQVNGLVETEPVRMQHGNKESTRRPWQIQANSIDPQQVAFEEVEPKRLKEIKELGNDPEIIDKLIDSFAPHLVGGERLRQAKLAVLLALAGGVKRNGKRGDINIFKIGDKGTGKSELLERANTIAPKSVQASGKGATAAGLTATATRSDYGEGWMLDPGALVLASGGVACIDEFDKMADSARKSMHEAMEQQKIPINKAGINTVLATETTVLAAANPAGGTFDRTLELAAQVNLESPILSRFDLILAFMDTVDETRDERIARQQHESNPSTGPISDDLLTEYIAYIRRSFNPDYASDSVKQCLIDYYVEKRQEAKSNHDDTSGFGPRMNDALRRLSEASARLRQSDTIDMEDAERAMMLMNRHIGDSMLNPDGSLKDHDPAYNQRPVTQRDRVRTIKDIIERLNEKDGATKDAILSKAKSHGISEDKTEHELQKLKDQGELYNPQGEEYRVI